MSGHSLYSGYSGSSSRSNRTSVSYCQPEPGRHHGGVYRETDPHDSRAVRFAAHFLQGPFSGALRKSDRQHSSSSSRHGHHHHGGSGSSSYSSAPSSSSRYSASSTRSRSPDSMRWQQQQQHQQQQYQHPQQQQYQHPQQQQYQQQQQQPRYPGPQAGYRPAGPGYGPAGQQQQQQPSFARQPPDVWGKGQPQQSGGWPGSGPQTTHVLWDD